MNPDGFLTQVRYRQKQHELKYQQALLMHRSMQKLSLGHHSGLWRNRITLTGRARKILKGYPSGNSCHFVYPKCVDELRDKLSGNMTDDEMKRNTRYVSLSIMSRFISRANWSKLNPNFSIVTNHQRKFYIVDYWKMLTNILNYFGSGC